MAGPPGDRPEGARVVQPRQGRPPDRLQPGRPRYHDEIPRLWKGGERRLGHRRLLGLDHEVSDQPTCLLPDDLISIVDRDRREDLDILDPADRLSTDGWILIVSGDLDQQVPVVPEVTPRGGANGRILALPSGYGAELLEQLHVSEELDTRQKIMHTRDRVSTDTDRPELSRFTRGLLVRSKIESCLLDLQSRILDNPRNSA